MVERGRQALDPAPVGLRDVGMNVGRGLMRVRQAGGEAVLFRLQLGQARGQGAVIAALLDDADDLGNGLNRLGKLAAGGVLALAMLAVEPIGFLRIGAYRLRRHGRRHHVIAQAGQHTGFQHVAGDGAGVVAAIGENVVGTGEAILPAPGVGAAATAAEHQPG